MKKTLLLIALLVLSSNTYAAVGSEARYCNSIRDIFLEFSKALDSGISIEKIEKVITNKRPSRNPAIARKAMEQQLLILDSVVRRNDCHDLYKTQQHAEDVFHICMGVVSGR